MKNIIAIFILVVAANCAFAQNYGYVQPQPFIIQQPNILAGGMPFIQPQPVIRSNGQFDQQAAMINDFNASANIATAAQNRQIEIDNRRLFPQRQEIEVIQKQDIEGMNWYKK